MTDTKNNVKNSNNSFIAQKFSKDILWVAISQVILVLASVIIIPALTKSYDSKIFGIWTQINITVGLLAPILSMHLNSAYIRYYSSTLNKNILRLALGSMIWPIITLGFFSFIFSLLFKQSIRARLYNRYRHPA